MNNKRTKLKWFKAFKNTKRFSNVEELEKALRLAEEEYQMKEDAQMDQMRNSINPLKRMRLSSFENKVIKNRIERNKEITKIISDYQGSNKSIINILLGVFVAIVLFVVGINLSPKTDNVNTMTYSKSEVNDKVTLLEEDETIESYTSAKSFEKALNNDKDVVGKTVTFKVDEVDDDSSDYFNLQAGEHLNFVSENEQDIEKGDTAKVVVTGVKKSEGSWIINYKLLDVVTNNRKSIATTPTPSPKATPKPTPISTPTPTPTSMTEPTPDVTEVAEEAVVVAAATAETIATSTPEPTQEASVVENSEPMVWVSRTGKKYHSRASCSNMKNPSQVTLSEAKQNGLTACKRCY